MSLPAQPTLTTLPPEILLNIISYLRFDTIITLRRVSGFFHDFNPQPTLATLLEVEQQKWSIAKHLLACSGCIRLRRSSQFSCNMLFGATASQLHRFSQESKASHVGQLELFPRDKRLCYECGERGLDGVIRCKGCKTEVDKVDRIMDMCASCYEVELMEGDDG